MVTKLLPLGTPIHTQKPVLFAQTVISLQMLIWFLGGGSRWRSGEITVCTSDAPHAPPVTRGKSSGDTPPENTALPLPAKSSNDSQ